MVQNTRKAGAAQRKRGRREEGRTERERGRKLEGGGREKQREISVDHQEKSPQCGEKGTLLHC